MGFFKKNIFHTRVVFYFLINIKIKQMTYKINTKTLFFKKKIPQSLWPVLKVRNVAVEASVHIYCINFAFVIKHSGQVL